VLFEALTYIEYIRERYYFSIVCTSVKAIKNVEVKVDVQMGALGFREKLTTNVLVHPIHILIYYCHIVFILNDHLVHS